MDLDVADRLSRSRLAAGRPSRMPPPSSPSSVGEGVLDGVLQQLGQDDGQRGGHVGRDLAQPPDRPRRSAAGTAPPSPRPSGSARSRSRRRAPGRPGSRDRISCTMAIDRTRRSASNRATLPAAGRQPPGLEPQQGRDGLEVVLDPVVHLADGRVLGQEQAVEAADVGHVAHQDQAPGHRRRRPAAGCSAAARSRRAAAPPPRPPAGPRPAPTRWPTPRCPGR